MGEWKKVVEEAKKKSSDSECRHILELACALHCQRLNACRWIWINTESKETSGKWKNLDVPETTNAEKRSPWQTLVLASQIRSFALTMGLSQASAINEMNRRTRSSWSTPNQTNWNVFVLAMMERMCLSPPEPGSRWPAVENKPLSVKDDPIEWFNELEKRVSFYLPQDGIVNLAATIFAEQCRPNRGTIWIQIKQLTVRTPSTIRSLLTTLRDANLLGTELSASVRTVKREQPQPKMPTTQETLRGGSVQAEGRNGQLAKEQQKAEDGERQWEGPNGRLQPFSRRPPGNSGQTCDGCGEIGHIRRFCLNPRGRGRPQFGYRYPPPYQYQFPPPGQYAPPPPAQHALQWNQQPWSHQQPQRRGDQYQNPVQQQQPSEQEHWRGYWFPRRPTHVEESVTQRSQEAPEPQKEAEEVDRTEAIRRRIETLQNELKKTGAVEPHVWAVSGRT